ncbi:N-acetyltransferase [Oerskovia sp. M15]
MPARLGSCRGRRAHPHAARSREVRGLGRERRPCAAPCRGRGASGRPGRRRQPRRQRRPDQRLVGYALLVRGVPGDPDIMAVVGDEPTVELSKIYVHPGSQGTGVAGDLMRAALDAASELVADRAVWLGTNGENARAQAFYRKHGFEVAGSRTYVVGGEPHDDVVMVRPLG